MKILQVSCVQCGKWICSKCTGVKKVIQKFSKNFACKKCEGNIGKAVEQENAM